MHIYSIETTDFTNLYVLHFLLFTYHTLFFQLLYNLISTNKHLDLR